MSEVWLITAEGFGSELADGRPNEDWSVEPSSELNPADIALIALQNVINDKADRIQEALRRKWHESEPTEGGKIGLHVEVEPIITSEARRQELATSKSGSKPRTDAEKTDVANIKNFVDLTAAQVKQDLAEDGFQTHTYSSEVPAPGTTRGLVDYYTVYHMTKPNRTD